MEVSEGSYKILLEELTETNVCPDNSEALSSNYLRAIFFLLKSGSIADVASPPGLPATPWG